MDIDKLVNRFLRWQLPKDVRPDSDQNEERSGTNLLTYDQARKMFEFVLGEEPKKSISQKVESNEFYEFMQHYRHTPLEHFNEVNKAYEAVKKFLTQD